MARENPDADDGLSARLVKPGLMGDMFGGPAAPSSPASCCSRFSFLLAACANLASLFAARTADRSREVAIRLAIGSSRWHVLRQLLCEAVLVSTIGGVLGTRLFVRASPRPHALATVPRISDSHRRQPGRERLPVALLLSVGSGLLWGLVPLRQVWSTSFTHAMKRRRRPLLFRRYSLRDLLLGAQIALCTLLVTASFVALRGMQRSLRAPLGFQPQNALLAQTDLQMAGHPDKSSPQLQKQMIDDARQPSASPRSASLANSARNRRQLLARLSEPAPPISANRTPLSARSSFPSHPATLEAAGTRLLSGRDFTWHDDDKAPRIAIVNETFAHKMFGNESPLGRTFLMGQNSPCEIVGIVEDGKYDSLTESPRAAMFFPLDQFPDTDTTLVVRSHSRLRKSPRRCAKSSRRLIRPFHS